MQVVDVHLQTTDGGASRCLATRSRHGITNCCWTNSISVCLNNRYRESRRELLAGTFAGRHLVVSSGGLGPIKTTTYKNLGVKLQKPG